MHAAYVILSWSFMTRGAAKKLLGGGVNIDVANTMVCGGTRTIRASRRPRATVPVGTSSTTARCKVR